MPAKVLMKALSRPVSFTLPPIRSLLAGRSRRIAGKHSSAARAAWGVPSTMNGNMLSMLSMLLFVGSSLFFIPFNCHGITLITAIPLSYMFTQYFISHRTRWLGNVLFLLFIAACVLLVL